MSAGYLKRSLVEKLGIKEGFKVIILGSPQDYGATLGKLPSSVSVAKKLKGPLDFIHFFTKSKKELGDQFPTLKRELSQDGILWVSWPKGSSNIKTDLNENIVREIGLRNGLVDVKVSAINEIWSGLKFVYRLKDRRARDHLASITPSVEASSAFSTPLFFLFHRIFFPLNAFPRSKN